ncbi:MAG TPA: glycosyltransferase family 9 protein [Candidatus Krumholzibacteria bacterium]|nr:glycosyltransferase family 9 protein [Candidatus Krumholzibacteria bacterium]HRX50432.1 glycosyltransferase family 9 protein [Candidatus Krumholzibacteria bacterium]
MTRPRVLILAPNWLGDLVMATTLLGRCDEAGVSPVVLVRRRWASLLRDDPRVGGLLHYERTGLHAGWRGLPRQAARLREAGPVEAVFVLPPSLRAAAAARLAGQGPRLGFGGEGRAPLLDVCLTRPPRGSLHYCEETDLLWRAYRPAAAGPAPEPALPGLRTAAPAAAAAHGRVWILAVGATYGSAKAWPAPIAAGFAAAAADLGVRLLLLGDAAAAGHVQAMAAARHLPWRGAEEPGDGVVDLTGRTDLSEAAGLLRSASVFVGNDSGLMHLAAALGAPTLGLFGSSNPAWTAPRGPRARALAVEGFACHPCHRRTCDQPRFCMETLTADAVLVAALELEEARP